MACTLVVEITEGVGTKNSGSKLLQSSLSFLLTITAKRVGSMDSDRNYQNNLNGRRNPGNGAVNPQTNTNEVVSSDNTSGNARDTEM